MRTPQRWTGIRSRIVRALPLRLKLFLAPSRQGPIVQDLMNRGLVTVGRHTYPRVPPVIYYPGDTAKVRIGSYTSIAGGCQLLPGGEHRTDWITTFPLRIQFDVPGKYLDGSPHSKGDIEIGNDVWLAKNSMVLSGVTIGDGAVVAAGAVVANDVPPFAMVAGVPARIVRFRFSDSQISALLRISWWDWDENFVLERIDDLCSANVDAFIRKYGMPRA